jgi:hypothetical protein
MASSLPSGSRKHDGVRDFAEAEGRDRNRALGIWGGAGAAGLSLAGRRTHACLRLGSGVSL